MTNLKLVRPIVFFDIESTGIDKHKDRIIELSMIKTSDFISYDQQSWLVDPLIPIPESASAIHGIFDKDVYGARSFKERALEILLFVDGCDLAGFNIINYDVPLLFNELARCGHRLRYEEVNLIDVGNIFKIQEPRTLGAAVRFYLEREHVQAHTARADNESTIDVFLKQLEFYKGVLPETAGELAQFSNFGKKMADISGNFSIDDDGDFIFNIGKSRGTKAKNDLGFVRWMVEKNFPADTLKICHELLNAGQVKQ
jgi:DNA polymerase-3 subunit epsilon